MDFDAVTKSRLAQSNKDQNAQIIKLLLSIQADVAALTERVEALTKKNKKVED